MLTKIHALVTRSSEGIGGISFNRHNLDARDLLSGKRKDKGVGVLFERKNYEHIWVHQYLRVKVLRWMFGRFPERIDTAKKMDFYKKNVTKPNDHRIFVTRWNYADFGESTSRGVLTKNCKASLLENGFSLPEWATTTTEREISIRVGNDPRQIARLLLPKSLVECLALVRAAFRR